MRNFAMQNLEKKNLKNSYLKQKLHDHLSPLHKAPKSNKIYLILNQFHKLKIKGKLANENYNVSPSTGKLSIINKILGKSEKR